MSSTPEKFTSIGSGICGDQASLGNSSKTTWMISNLLENPHLSFASNYLSSDYSNFVADDRNTPANEFSFDGSFLGDAFGSQDIEISQDDEGLAFSMGPKDLTQSICQPSLINSLNGIAKSISNSGPVSNPTSSSETEVIDDRTRRKMAHCRTERNYRENMNLMFLQLEEVLSNRHFFQNKSPEKLNKRVKRTRILQQAHNDILELREEVKLLKEKLGILVETAFPDTYKYVLKDSG